MKLTDAIPSSDLDEPDLDPSQENAATRYKVPDAGVAELLAFIDTLRFFRPNGQQETIQYYLRGRRAIMAAAEKALRIAADADKKLPGYDRVEPMLLYYRAEESRALSAAERDKLVDDLKMHLAQSAVPPADVVKAAHLVARFLELDRKSESAANAYRAFGEILAGNKEPRLARIGVEMEGATRRLTFVGQPLEVTGTEMNGAKFDWAKYRGKVVLVDFWATWCGPCLAELPNVKQNYDLYHDKGFDVVGVSLDSDRTALEKFLENEKTPWVTLHDDGAESPTVIRYGIHGIPLVILVGKDGNVVSTDVRGAKLGELLEKLLVAGAAVK